MDSWGAFPQNIFHMALKGFQCRLGSVLHQNDWRRQDKNNQLKELIFGKNTLWQKKFHKFSSHNCSLFEQSNWKHLCSWWVTIFLWRYILDHWVYGRAFPCSEFLQINWFSFASRFWAWNFLITHNLYVNENLLKIILGEGFSSIWEIGCLITDLE